MKGITELGRRKRVLFGWVTAALLLGFILAASWDSTAQSPGPRTREQKKQEYRDQVARETVQESVRNACVSGRSTLFSPPSMSSSELSATRLTRYMKQDPRIAKLLDTIEHGSPADVEAAHGELIAAIATHLKELPLVPSPVQPGTQNAPTYWDDKCSAIPLLLAAFPPSLEHLCLLVAMADRILPTVRTETSMLLAYNADRILSGLADGDVGKESYSEGQRAAMEAYVQYRSERRDRARDYLKGLVDSGSFGPSDQAEMDAMGSGPYLDFMSWSNTFSLGPPAEDPALDDSYERETMVFARRMCSETRKPS